MPTFPNQFTGPPSTLFKAGRAAFFALGGFIFALAVLFILLFTPLSPLLSWPLVVAFSVLLPAVFAASGYRGADSDAVKQWDRLPSFWKVDPVTIDERGVSGVFEDPLDPTAPTVEIRIPYERIRRVTATPEGWWVSGWDPDEGLKSSLEPYYVAHRTEIRRKGLIRVADTIRAEFEATERKRLLEIPRLDRGGLFVLSPENGSRLKTAWDASRTTLRQSRGTSNGGEIG